VLESPTIHRLFVAEISRFKIGKPEKTQRYFYTTVATSRLSDVQYMYKHKTERKDEVDGANKRTETKTNNL
jgi:hypothetical protein